MTDKCDLPLKQGFRHIAYKRAGLPAEFVFGYFHSWGLRYNDTLKRVVTGAIIETPTGVILFCDLQNYQFKFVD